MLFQHRAHVNGRIITLTDKLRAHPDVQTVELSDSSLDDVLYLSIGAPRPAADSEETPEGHIGRYDEHDRVIGVTIVGARDLLGQDGAVSLTLPRRSVTADSRELEAALAP